jgi:hypothetical protein
VEAAHRATIDGESRAFPGAVQACGFAAAPCRRMHPHMREGNDVIYNVRRPASQSQERKQRISRQARLRRAAKHAVGLPDVADGGWVANEWRGARPLANGRSAGSGLPSCGSVELFSDGSLESGQAPPAGTSARRSPRVPPFDGHPADRCRGPARSARSSPAAATRPSSQRSGSGRGRR